MKRALKIILFSFLSVVGAFGLVLGGMYLFGGFNEKPVFAKNLSFSKSEVITSTAFELDLTTTTPDVTRKEVVLEVSSDDIIYYTATANVGDRINIAPKRDENGKNIGGYVKLTARYADPDSDSTASATCNILIDVPVESATIKPLGSPKFEPEILLVSSGTRLSDFISTYPVNSLKPYASMTVINNAHFTTFKNKSIFLEATYRDEANMDVAQLKIDNKTSTLLQLPYEYNSSINDFVISKDVYVMPSESSLTLGINCYVVPTVEMMNDTNLSLSTVLSMGLVNSAEEMIVKNYSVDSVSFNGGDKTIYFDEQQKFYINNPDATDGYNLGIELINDNGIKVSDDLFKAYFSVKDGDGNPIPIFNMDSQANIDKSTWYFQYKYSNFETYYNYSLDPTDNSGKLPIYLYYAEPDSEELMYSFYLVPDIHNVGGVSAIGNNNITLNNGDKLNMNGRAEVIGQGPSPFDEIKYFVTMNTANNVSTMPSDVGSKYKVVFDFTMPIQDEIVSITLYPNSSWTDLKNTAVTIKTQEGVEVFKATFDSTGSSSVDNSGLIVAAGTLLTAEIDNIEIKSATNGYISLLNIETKTGRNITINNKQTKFYDNETADGIPYLSINGVTYNCEFDYYVNDDKYYVIIDTEGNTNPDYFKLSGVGSFSVVAMLLYKQDTKIYLLNRSTVFTVEVKEVINDGDVIVSDFSPSAGESKFTTATIENDEDQATDFYLYISSSKMLALKSAIENNKVHISSSYVLPDDSTLKNSTELASYLDNDADDSKLNTIKSIMQNINRNAITFASNWEEVRNDKNVIIGYKIKYNINQVYSISLNDNDLENRFDITLAIETDSGEKSVQFNVEGGSNPSSIKFIIKDNVYNSIFVSKENMKLQAMASTEGELVWKIDGSAAGADDLGIKYGLTLKDSPSSEPDLSSPSYCSFKIKADDSSESSLPAAYYYFDVAGGIHFRNFPYKEGGIKVIMTVKQNVLSDDKCHYVFNSQTNTFDKKIYEEISTGKSIEFTITGMKIEITANEERSVVGAKENTVKILGSDGIFKVDIKDGAGNNVSGVIKYSNFFKVDLVGVGNSSAISLTSISENNELSIDKDFIKDEYLGFKFSYYGDNTYPFLANAGVSNIFTKEIESAFKIELKENEFSAPSEEDYVSSFKYKETDAFEMSNVTFVMSALNDDYSNLYTIDNVSHKFIFKACTESFAFGVRITITITDDDEMVRSVSYDYVNDIQVEPKYTEDMLQMGTVVEPLDPDGEKIWQPEMTAGEECGLSVDNNGISLSGALSTDMDNITRVEVSFEDISSGVSPTAGMHMRQNGQFDASSFGFFSYDLSEEKDVRVIVTFYFGVNGENGTFVVQKIMTIKPNLNIVLAGSDNGVLTLNSGDTINLSSGNNFLIYKDDLLSGSIDNRYFESDGEDYRYSRYSFDFGGKENYFLDVNSATPTDPYLLQVKYSSVNEEINIDVVFTYVVDTEPLADTYNISIILHIKLNLTTQG